MKRPISIICMVLLLAAALASTMLVGCGGSTTETTESVPEELQTGTEESTPSESSTATEEEDRQALEDILDKQAAESADFDHNTIDRVAFAEDSQGTKWALVEVTTFTTSSPQDGTTETHVFKQENGEWTQVSAGSSGFSEGVPEEVQQQLDIEGQ